MPLTDKGKQILKDLKDIYGPEKGRQVFYALIEAGKIPKNKVEKPKR